MAAVVDEGEALGGVIDEYFAFIYEEPTEEDAVSNSSEQDIEELDDDGFALDEDERFQLTVMPSGSDLLLQTGIANGGSLSNISAGKETGKFHDEKFPEKFLEEKFHTPNERVLRSPGTTGDSEGGSGVVLSKHSGAQNFTGSSFLEGARNAGDLDSGSASKRLKTERVPDMPLEPNGARFDGDGALEADNDNGALVWCDNGKKSTPSTVSISISPSSSPSDRAPIQSGTTTASSSTTYIGGSCRKTGKSVINLSTHLPPIVPWKPEIQKDLPKDFKDGDFLGSRDSREGMELRSGDSHSTKSDSSSRNSDSKSDEFVSKSDYSNSSSGSTEGRSGNRNSHSIYINGNDEDDSRRENNNFNTSRSSSVYLNGLEEKATELHCVGEDGGDFTSAHEAAVPVSIKVSLDSSSFPTQNIVNNGLDHTHQQNPKLDLVLEKFLEEIQQPRERQNVPSRNTKPNPDSVYQENNSNNNSNSNSKNNNNSSDIFETVNPVVCGKGKIVFDYLNSGDTSDRVLDVGSIECDILDELFEGMRVKNEIKERLAKNIAGDGINNNDISTVKSVNSNSNIGAETEAENFFDLVAVPKLKLSKDSVVEMDGDHVENSVFPNEDCNESLVQSWQYIAYGENRENLENLENSVIEKASKPVDTLEAVFNSKDEVDALHNMNVGRPSAREDTDRSGECKDPKGKCKEASCLLSSKDSKQDVFSEGDLAATLASNSPPVGQVFETSAAPPSSPSCSTPSSHPQNDIALSTSSHPESYSQKTSSMSPSSSPAHSSSSPHLPASYSSQPHSSPSDIPTRSHENDSSFSQSPSKSTPLPHQLDPLSANEYIDENTQISHSFPPYNHSPSPSPSSQPHSLSSLPPNLSPTASHTNFFASHSPLSFNPPSLELPEILTPTPTTSDYFPDTECDRSDYYSWQEVGGAVGGSEGGEEGRPEGVGEGIGDPDPSPWHLRSPTGAREDGDNNNSHHTSLRLPTEDDQDSEDDQGVGRGLAAAVSRVVRRSMRRMKRLRLSGRQKSPGTSSSLSEETEVRRAVPAEPSIGLATVRSPAAASIIVTSLVAALAPPPLNAPREVLDPPPANIQTNNRQDEIETAADPVGANRRHRRRQRRPWGGGGGGGGGRREERGRERRASYDNALDLHLTNLSPSAPPTSLEVEIGGYAPTSASAPVSLVPDLVPDVVPDVVPGAEQDFRDFGLLQQAGTLSPSNPPSLELILPTSLQSWEAATVIPRPSITHAPGHNGRRNSNGNNNGSSSNSNGNSSGNISSSSSSIIHPASVSQSSAATSPTSSTDFPSSNSSEGRQERQGNDSNPRNVVLERRRQRRRGNGTTNDTNNNNNHNNNNNNNNNSNNNRNYTTAEAPTPPSNNRNRNNNNNNNNNNNSRNTSRQSPRRNNNYSGSSGVTFESERLRVQGGTWSHQQSGLMASLAVTVTTFNISRFAVLGAKFGWPFVVQWIVISIVLGLPLMTFHVTIGQYLGAGVVDMWRISPIFQGVGYSLVVAQALVGVYCCVPVAWLFIFFRDSFITHNNMFRWADCRFMNCSRYNNFSTIIIEGVPKYFNSQVLQRSDEETSWLQELGSIKFDMAVNIALIWIITLIALSRGNRSYGRVAYIVFLLPLLGYLVVCLYLASWTKYDIYMNLPNNINELFRTSQSWMAASREVFLVWGFHGAVLQQMSAHNKKGHPLYRDTTVLAIITSLALVLAAVTGSSCVSGLYQNKLYYKPSSFENSETAQFLSETSNRYQIDFEALLKHFPMVTNIPPQLWGEYMHHDNFYAGIRIRPPNLLNAKKPETERSGYQSLRLGTELFPALLAVNGAEQISPFWSSLFYFSLLLFGIAQQLAVWRTVVEAVIRINRERLQAWEIFITFLCCLFGFSAALPMATGVGIQILYFLDYVLSCGWWLMIIQLVQIFALLFVRGKPYSGQDIVGELMGKNEQCRSLWLGPLTSFSWNIIVPVGLLVLSISSFKSGQYRDVFDWGDDGYWPVWARQLASALQLFPILLVPLVGLIQTCRYLTATDDDLFEKIQLLYRPSLRQRSNANSSPTTNTEESDVEGTTVPQESQEEETITPRPYSDPPPKYTPPPSYSTATGVRFAKLLNHSLRQSMRRLRDTLRNGTESNANPRENEEAQENSCTQSEESTSRRDTPYIPPPDYVTVVGECDTQRSNSAPSEDPPPMYATLDPLRRQRALAAMANATTSTANAKSDTDLGMQRPATPVLQRNSSVRGSSLRRSIASGVRHSARRIAATLGVRSGEDDPTLVNSEEPPGQDGESFRDEEEYHPHAYTNFEMISQSEA